MLLMLYHKKVDLISDGGVQVQRAMDFADKNGQPAAKALVEQLAHSARTDVSSFLESYLRLQPCGMFDNVST